MLRRNIFLFAIFAALECITSEAKLVKENYSARAAGEPCGDGLECGSVGSYPDGTGKNLDDCDCIEDWFLTELKYYSTIYYPFSDPSLTNTNRCSVCHGKSCLPRGDWNCGCSEDRECQAINPHSECASGSGTCQCAEDHVYYLNKCIPSSLDYNCTEDSDCEYCFGCNLDTGKCVPKAEWGCACNLNETTHHPICTSDNSQCGAFHLCECTDGYIFDYPNHKCSKICNCTGLSGGVIAGLVIGALVIVALIITSSVLGYKLYKK